MATPQTSALGNTGTGANPGATAGTGQQDMLDKGVDMGMKKAGHGTNASTTEKISDGIRTGFKKMTGKDVPVADKQ